MNKWIIVICALLFVLAGILVGRLFERRRFRRKLQSLNLTLDTVMRGNLSPDWSPYQEGEISLLANQLELLVKRTEHMVDRLNGEKAAIHDFIADISHQIKTPLTGLITCLDLLERSETDASKKARIEDCIYLAERMNDLVWSLLELARLDSGTAALHIETVAAAEIMESAKQAALAARPDAKSSFLTDIEDGIVIRCDKKWFVQALVNVLVNALDHSADFSPDFSRDHSIDFSANFSPDFPPIRITVRQDDGVAVIKILDHSGGIEESELQNIFKRFYRTRNSQKGGYDSKREGFGIGLSMAESIVRLHKGNIRALNEGDGLAMVITLPLLPCMESVKA